ncbi:hypothetical protein BH11PAT2_BH11PAT2_07690 [soil metagenome]
MYSRQPTLSLEVLKNLYSKKHLSTWKIAEMAGVSRSHVRTLLQRYCIPIRTSAEAHRQYERKPFDGSEEDRAYLLGFAIGDLRVRRQHKGGETIGIACSSTHSAQISLIYNLFSPYGRVWIGKENSKGVVAIEAFVDLSFSFLLKKTRNIEWVFRKESHFYAFLAGFTDAEGSICVTRQGKMILAWGQYDQNLLQKIHDALQVFGYRVGNVRSDHLAGYQGKDGYIRNKDYHHLVCAARESLLKLLIALKSYIRHDEKKAKSKLIRAKLEKALKISL